MASEKVPSTSLSANFDPPVRLVQSGAKFACRLVSGTFSDANTIKKGFTLIEILIVIAIMAVLIVLTLNSFSGYRQEAVLKLTEENILSNVNEAKLKVAHGKQGQADKLVCFGVLLEKDKEGVTVLQWPYSAQDFYLDDRLQTGRCEDVDVASAKVVKEFRPFQEKVAVAGLFVDGNQQDSEAAVYLIFEPPQAKLKVGPDEKFKELKVLLQTQSGGERDFSLDLLTGNAL